MMFIAFLLTGEQCGQARLSKPLFRPIRLRWDDYTRGAAANQLDDGIGDTFVLGPVE